MAGFSMMLMIDESFKLLKKRYTNSIDDEEQRFENRALEAFREEKKKLLDTSA